MPDCCLSRHSYDDEAAMIRRRLLPLRRHARHARQQLMRDYAAFRRRHAATPMLFIFADIFRFFAAVSLFRRHAIAPLRHCHCHFAAADAIFAYAITLPFLP